MKIIKTILAMCFSVCFIFILLISAFELAAYSDYGWYKKAYEKYEVCDDLDMEMDDVMAVTKEMMVYLIGKRQDLVVNTVVGGKEREFFNDREKAHMKDVQVLFVGGIHLRRIALVILCITVLLLLIMKVNLKRMLAKAYLIGAGVFSGAIISFGIVISKNFYPYFELFHEIFFTNDLWLLDWNTDLLIRMLPEGFFFDMVFRIGSVFLVLIVLFAAISIAFLLKKRKNKKNL